MAFGATPNIALDTVREASVLDLRDTLIDGFYNDIWYVNKSVTTSGDGKHWSTAFKTITEATTAAGNYDVIFIAPGFYTEAAAITLTQTGLKIVGLNSSGKTRGPCAMKTPTAAGHMLIIPADVNDVEIRNLAFIATGAYNAITLGAAATGYVWRTHIHDCAFFGDGVGAFAIANYGATVTPSAGNFPDVAEAVVENCHFYLWGASSLGAICLYGTRAMVKNNVIYTEAAATGIVVGTGRPYQTIVGNVISGVNSTDVGIRITGDAATWVCHGNVFLNLSLALTQDTGIAAVSSENYKAVTNGVYTVVDTTAG